VKLWNGFVDKSRFLLDYRYSSVIMQGFLCRITVGSGILHNGIGITFQHT